MDQQQSFPDDTQMVPDGQQYQQQQQQPQWQPQQQTMPMQQAQPQPQYAQMLAENPTMQMPMQNASTPRLNAMYSQGGQQLYQQPTQQENLAHEQQGFVQRSQGFTQRPQVFQDNRNANLEQMQQAPQNLEQQVPAREYHQQAQIDPSMNPGAQQGQFLQKQQPPQQQHQAAPQAGYQFAQDRGQPPAWPGPQPVNAEIVAPDADASACEQTHVTEVNDNAGFNQQRFADRAPPPTSHRQQQNQAIREAELHNARQRIEALEAEREQQEVAQALASSARDAPDRADIEEQLQQQIHQAQLLSLDAWEQEVRRTLQQQQGGNNQAGGMYDGGTGGGSWQQQPLAPPSHLGSNFSDPRGGAALNGPIPSMQQGQMPPPPTPSARGSVSNLGFRSPTPRSQTPTRGVPLSDATRNAAAEDAQRWEAYHRGQNAQGGASVSAGSEYTILPEYSEASTARGGSKGKGRMS